MSFQVEIDKAIKEKKLYFIGDALPSDWYAAFKLWLPLAEVGDAKAQYNIGRCYDRGDGIEQDSIQAKNWYLKAAEQNDPRALFNLYLFYKDGKSGEKDLEKAEGFLTRAVELKEFRALSAKQGRESDTQTTDFHHLNRELEKTLLPLLAAGKFEEAKKIILNTKDSRLSWASNYLDYFKIELISHELHSDIEKTYTKTGGSSGYIINGVFRSSANVDEKKWVKYKAKVLLKNNSDRPLLITLADESKNYTYRVGGTKKILANTTEWFEFEGGGVVIGFSPETFDGGTEYDEEKTKEGKLNRCHIVKINDEEIKYYLRTPIFKFSEPISIPYTELKKGCFVLTACYGNENHPVVMSFRNFRDSYLLKTQLGEKFIDAYYKHGPKWAISIKDKPLVKLVFRAVFRLIAAFLPKGSK